MIVLMSEPAEFTSASCRSGGACCSYSTEWPRKASLALVKFPVNPWMTSEVGCDAMAIAVPLS